MPKYSRKEGFTLAEMLTVMFIVSILICIALGTANYAAQVSRKSLAKRELHSLADALDRFYLVYGDYPDVPVTNLITYTRNVLDSSDNIADDADKYQFANLLPQGFTAIDPWNNPYIYAVIKEGDDVIYSISCSGPDGKEDTEDDITID